jgi:hypothetical protein
MRNSNLLEHLHTASSSHNADHAEGPAVMRHMTEKPTRLCLSPESRSRTRRPQVRTCPSSTSWPISPLIINGHNEIPTPEDHMSWGGICFKTCLLSSALVCYWDKSHLHSQQKPSEAITQVLAAPD